MLNKDMKETVSVFDLCILFFMLESFLDGKHQNLESIIY